MKVFLDTNVLVSAFTARGLCTDLFRFLLAEHDVMTGEVNLVELRRVLAEHFHASDRQLAFVERQLRDQWSSRARRPQAHFRCVILMMPGCWLRPSRGLRTCWSLGTRTC